MNIGRMALRVGCIVLIGCLPASGAIYQWVDCNGRKHFTDRPSQVPPASCPQQDSARPAPVLPDQQAIPPAIEADRAQLASDVAPLRQSNDVLFVDVLLNGTVRLPMLLDTGASYTILPTDTARRLGISWHTAEHVPIRAVGQTFQAPLTRVRTLSIGRAIRHNVPVIVYGNGIDQRQTGILGMSFLKHFAFTIDLATQRLILTPLASRPCP